MVASKFLTSRGRLRPYAFYCGYIEKKTSGMIETNLWHEGGICYHVRQHDFSSGKRVFWECFSTLTEARRLFDKQPGRLS